MQRTDLQYFSMLIICLYLVYKIICIVNNFCNVKYFKTIRKVINTLLTSYQHITNKLPTDYKKVFNNLEIKKNICSFVDNFKANNMNKKTTYYYPAKDIWLKYIGKTKSLIDDKNLYIFHQLKRKKQYILSEEDINTLLTSKQIYHETDDRRTKDSTKTRIDFSDWGITRMAH